MATAELQAADMAKVLNTAANNLPNMGNYRRSMDSSHPNTDNSSDHLKASIHHSKVEGILRSRVAGILRSRVVGILRSRVVGIQVNKVDMVVRHSRRSIGNCERLMVAQGPR